MEKASGSPAAMTCYPTGIQLETQEEVESNATGLKVISGELNLITKRSVTLVQWISNSLSKKVKIINISI